MSSRHPEILPTHTPQLFADAVTRAADLLRAGEVVALPTETVYGLAANALNPQAVEKIYAAKGRPAHNPIIVHVASREQARRCAAEWPPAAEALAQSFWPGPLTVVVPRAPIIPEIVTAGGATVGLRWPSHPFIQAVIQACGFPLAAPSANRSNEISPTNAEHVRRSLGAAIPLIIDGGQAQVGIESTVVDLTTSRARILRPGIIHGVSLQAALAGTGIECGREEPGQESGALRSPGLLRKHYSPRARLRVMAWESDEELAKTIAEIGVGLGKVQIIAHTRIPLSFPASQVSVIPHDPEAFARALYAELHQCDEAGAEWIIVETLPETPEWDGIRDRLQRAAAE